MRSDTAQRGDFDQHVDHNDRLYFSLFVVFLGTILPRLAVIGGVPTTDEGIYAAQAQFISASLFSGHGLPDAGPLMLYPLLTAWIFKLGWNPLVLLRLVDLAVASTASWLFYRLIRKESGSAVAGVLIAVVFLWAMNQVTFIQYGYRNSIVCASNALFLALALVEGAPTGKLSRWWGAGSLVALAVLLREPLFPFAIVGSIAATLAGRWQGGLAFVMGGLSIAVIGLGGICLARGDTVTLFGAYDDYASIYAVLDHDRWHNFFLNGGHAVRAAGSALIIGSGGALLAVRATSRPSAPDRGRFWLWLTLAVVPLWEPTAKIGFPYHFAVCLPGLAGLAAFGWRHRAAAFENVNRIALGAGGTAVAMVIFVDAIAIARQAPASAAVLGTVTTEAWPASAVDRSNFLLAAEAIRASAPAHATLSVSGYMWGLHPLTGMLPPTYRLEDLNIAAIELRLDEARLQALIASCPPDILVITKRNMPGTEIAFQAVTASGLYRPVGEIPVTARDRYGAFGGTIYRKIDPEPSTCTTP